MDFKGAEKVPLTTSPYELYLCTEFKLHSSSLYFLGMKRLGCTWVWCFGGRKEEKKEEEMGT